MPKTWDAYLRHANYYLSLLRKCNDQYVQKENLLEGLRSFDFEWGNIKSAQGWVLQNYDKDVKIEDLGLYYPLVGAGIFGVRQNPFERIKWLDLGLIIARKRNLIDHIEIFLNNLGLAYGTIGDYATAVVFFQQGLDLTVETGNMKARAACLGNLGHANSSLGKLEDAREYYDQALNIGREIGDIQGESNALSNIGMLYAQQKEGEKAIEYLEKSLELDRKLGDSLGEGRSLGYLGLAYAGIGGTDQAIEHYQKAIDILEQFGELRSQGQFLGNRGSNYAF
jgi:tetratricopeptide (TPR) repeat protein